MYNIAADVGGTNTRFALLHTNDPNILLEKQYRSADFNDFEVVLRAFIEGCRSAYGDLEENVSGLSLAFAGVVTESSANLTNLPWIIEKSSLRRQFNVNLIYFMNDFVASAMGLAALKEQDKIVLNKGRHISGAMRVITGAGTGLGVAWVQDAEHCLSAHSSEGGHMDFAPVNDTQIALLKFILVRHGHASYERLLSGDGLVALYDFSADMARGSGIAASDVIRLAESGDEHATQAVTLFVQIYGAYVGNLALLFKPGAGIYVAGGIAAKIHPWMEADCFMQSYCNKGRLNTLAKEIPVYLVVNEQVGMLGAARRLYGGDDD